MASQFTPNVTKILVYSREEAARLASDAVGPEHLLLGMLRLKDSKVAGLLASLDVDTTDIKSKLEAKVKGGDVVNNNPSSLNLNERASNILKLAVLEARIQHQTDVDDIHILLGILHDIVRNGAREVLENSNVHYGDIVDALYTQTRSQQSSERIEMSMDEDDDDSYEEVIPGGQQTQKKHTATKQQKNESKTPMLDNFGVDLTAAARRGALDPVVGRHDEIMRVTEILGRRKKNNPVLIGEPGVGKSAIVEGLAQMIANRHTSPLLFNKRIINLDLTGIVAGTKYRGQFEERMKVLMKEIEKNPDIIIFIDEIHTLIGAGSSPGTMDAANILKPALARGVIQCIGATTLDEYRNSIEKDGALERRFQKILVEPTSKEETLQILKNIRGRYEDHHHVRYTDDALKACVELTARYVTDRHFPDKAIDALDEAGSHIRICKYSIPKAITDKEAEIATAAQEKKDAVKNQKYELAASFRDLEVRLQHELQKLNEDWSLGEGDLRENVEDTDVAKVVSVMTGVPVEKIGVKEGVRLKGMAASLKADVVAQDNAITNVVKAIQRNRIGLNAANRPIGVFMFLGPTGVGKTYLAKKLAEFMFGTKDAIIRIDMSEYSEQFNVSRLVGAPPGYVGYDQGGQLTERVRRHPYSIVLLDEIEKAHPNVFNILLQVFDDGRLTDGTGRAIDFRNTVIIMTSNTGTRQLKDFAHGIGFNAAGISDGLATDEKDKEYARSVIQKALNRQFSPEFLNRLDDIITFDQLDLKAIRQIVDLELRDFYPRVEALGYKLHISDEAKDFLAQKGYDVQFGARPLKRAIQNHIEDGLGEMVLNGTLQIGSTISITKSSEKDELLITAHS